MMIALFVGIGLILANFAYQVFTAMNWSVAIERSWFQVTACIIVSAVEYISMLYSE